MSERRRNAPRGNDPRGSEGGRHGGYAGDGRSSMGAEGPRPTRAEMRKAAQAASRRGGRRKAGGGGGSSGATGPGRTPPGKKRFIDYPRWGKQGFRRWVPSWKQMLGMTVTFFGCLLGAFGIAYVMVSIPPVNPSTQLQNNIFQWSDGSQMASVGQVNRQNVDLSRVPQKVQWDFLAAENSTFYTDSGVDMKGMARAIVDMAKGGDVQSGSTITQQFVKNAYLNQNQTATRKLKEIMISLKIGVSHKLTKDDILQGYLNSNYYGRGAYGIQAAAQAYYREDVSNLTVSQGAFLTATVNEPSVMMNADSDPAAKAAATARWKYVIQRMQAIGKISPSEEQQVLAAGFPTPKPAPVANGMSGQVGYLAQLAESYVEQHAHITDQQFNQGGYTIRTTFDKKKVNELSAAVAAMEKKNLNPKARSADKDVQVGAASVDPTTGAIEAIYGGAGYDKGYYVDNANSTGVPVGSTFKPFDLAAAIDHGAVLSPGAAPSPISPDSKFLGNDGIEIKNQQGQYIQDGTDPTGLLHQQNDVTTKWGYITLREAMEQSVNTPYVQLGEYTGYDNVENEALSAGLLRSSLQYDTAGFYIGTSTPSPIRMADAYATFDDNGMHHEPYSVTSVTSAGQPLPGFTPPAGTQAMPASTASNVSDVLQDVVKYGTGTNAKAIGRPAAGKTGTTDDYKSAWFIGYTPQLSTSIAMFKENPTSGTLLSMEGVGGYSKVFGADMPTQVWTDYMGAALDGQPVVNFPPAAQLPKGSDENGAPLPTPSTSITPSNTPSDTPNPSHSNPSPSTTPCSQRPGGCSSPPPSHTPGGDNGGWGILGGQDGGGGPTPSGSQSPGGGAGGGKGNGPGAGGGTD
ncbi:transglycosylase domain-containing protein [Streptantibioticus parmotrematis]|uniref:transglycosylase domain-containing protein n=1 Tax=Streptantibioticus parmotrematis TaxID=2873249 RepID=UPI0034059D07